MKLTSSPCAHLWYILSLRPVPLLITFLLIAIGRGIATLWPYTLKILISNISVTSFSPNSIHLFGKLIAAFLLLFLCSEGSLRAAAYLSIKPLLSASKEMRLRYFSHILDQSYSHMTEQYSGKISSMVIQLCSATDALLDLILWVFFSTLMNIVVASVLFSSTNPLIGCLFVVWFMLYLPCMVYMVKKGGKRWGEVAKKESQVAGKMVDTFSNLLAVKIFSKNDAEKQSLVIELDETYKKTEKAALFSVHSYTFQESATFLLGFFTLILCFFLYKYQKISAGEIGLVLALFMVLKEKFHSLATRTRDFFKQYGILRDVLNTFSEISVPLDPIDAKNIPLNTIGIKFCNVDFSYPNGTHVFKNLNLHIKPGEKVGIVGKSGAGKSTLVYLLLRLMTINTGELFINDVNIKDIKLNIIRAGISVVPQDPLLFHRSIWENIQYGLPDASEAEVKRAAKLAQCCSFISHLQKGYESIVGERGVKLSGGQRQRIAFARAILKNSPLIIFDEATSALDSESEEDIQSAFLPTIEGKTILFIAHRLSTLRFLDRILVLDNGKIAEEGSHHTLIAKKGLYQQMWNLQTVTVVE